MSLIIESVHYVLTARFSNAARNSTKLMFDRRELERKIPDPNRYIMLTGF